MWGHGGSVAAVWRPDRVRTCVRSEMTYPAYLRERARELRTKKQLSLDEIAERLALPKTTVYYWISDLPLGRARRENGHPGNVAMQVKYRRLREEAYARGLAEYDELMSLPSFRDFLVLYIAEGYKRSRGKRPRCRSFYRPFPPEDEQRQAANEDLAMQVWSRRGRRARHGAASPYSGLDGSHSPGMALDSDGMHGA